MNPSRSFLTRLASNYGLVGSELDAFSTSFEGIRPHPQNPRAYMIERATDKEQPRAFACVEFLIDTWTNPKDPTFIGACVAYKGDSLWIDGPDDTSMARSLIGTLERLERNANHLVVWNGRGVVFHTFLRHLAPHLALMGATIQPYVSGVDIKAIIVKLGSRSWALCDSGAMSGLSRMGQEAFCDAFGASYVHGYTNAERLSRAVGNFQQLLLKTVNVGIRTTIASVALKAMRYYLPPDTRWYRPNLPLESVCRYALAYRGGYVYSEPYRGPAHRIDVNKMYTSLLRFPLPAGCSLGYAGEKGKERAGIFLCRIEGESYFPAYVSAYSVEQGRFHKQNTRVNASWAWLVSTEFMGLRAIGYDVVPSLGFIFTNWVRLAPFADHLLSLQKLYARDSAESLIAKMVGNALTGKLGQSPEHLNVCYSTNEPGDGWLPYVTVERDVIPGLWIQKHLDFKGGQHVDSAAWLTAAGRNKVYNQLATVHALGWRAVHVDTDGIILDSDPRNVLRLSQDRPGEWRYDGYDPDCIVDRSKWYSFRGEVHTAGLNGMTREQLEAVHYGKRVVIGQKVLASPFIPGPIERQVDYYLGG